MQEFRVLSENFTRNPGISPEIRNFHIFIYYSRGNLQDFEGNVKVFFQSKNFDEKFYKI